MAAFLQRQMQMRWRLLDSALSFGSSQERIVNVGFLHTTEPLMQRQDGAERSRAG